MVLFNTQRCAIAAFLTNLRRRRCSTASMLAGAPAATDHGAAAAITPQQMIESFEGTFGVHPGQRRNHIKGTCAAGEFVGTADAAALSRSPLFTGKSIPVVARFSLGGGNPDVPDAAPAPRGMALEFVWPAAACSTSP
jgi:catalase